MEDRRESGGHLAVCLALLVCAGALGIPPASAGAERVLLAPSVTMTDLKQRALYRPDPEGILSAEALLASDEGFEPYDPALEQEAPPLWLKIKLRQPADYTGQHVLLVKSRFFPRLDVYVPNAHGEHERINSGVRNYEPTEKLGHHFVYKFNLGSQERDEILVFTDIFQRRLSALDLELRDELAFQEHRSVSYWAYGLYFGAMLALIFYNFILYLNLGTPGHRLYVTAMSCMILLMGLNSGLLQNRLPEFLQELGPLPTIFITILATVATTRFFQVFVNSRFYIPAIHRLLQWVIGLFVVLGITTLFTPVQLSVHLGITVQPLASLTFLLLLLASAIAAFRGSKSAYIFLAAWAAWVVGAVTWSLLSFDFVRRIPAAEYSLYIGSVMEAMILALGLSYRVGQLRTQRNRALRAQQKAARLANIDPLTGAYNRRFLENYLDGLMNSNDKRAFGGSLIMLDMDHFKEINDQFGHAMGDAVLREMAQRCLDTLRTEDVLARLGGDEFAVVLPDQSGKDAIAVAERIRKAIAVRPVTHENHSIPMATSIGVVTHFRPGASAYSAFKHADQAMYEAKRAGRNQVMVTTGASESVPAQANRID